MQLNYGTLKNRTLWFDVLEDKKNLAGRRTKGFKILASKTRQKNRILEQIQVLNIWKNSIRELHDRPNRPQTLKVKTEEEVDTDENGPYILQKWSWKSHQGIEEYEVCRRWWWFTWRCSQIIGRSWFENKDKINTIYETVEWPKDLTKFKMIAIKYKPQATKCNDHRTVSLIARTTKIVTKILRRKFEKKIEDVLEEEIILGLEDEKELGMQLGCWEATKCNDHLTVSLIARTTKIVTKILRRKIEKKIEGVLGEVEFGFRRWKGTRDAI